MTDDAVKNLAPTCRTCASLEWKWPPDVPLHGRKTPPRWAWRSDVNIRCSQDLAIPYHRRGQGLDLATQCPGHLPIAQDTAGKTPQPTDPTAYPLPSVLANEKPG